MIKLTSTDLGATNDNIYAVIDLAGIGRLAVRHSHALDHGEDLDMARAKLASIGWAISDGAPWSSALCDGFIGSAGDFDVYEIHGGMVGPELFSSDSIDLERLCGLLDTLDDAISMDFPDRERGSLLPG